MTDSSISAFKLHKKWSFLLRVSSVNLYPNPQFPADLVMFIEEILNGKLHFSCSVSQLIASIFHIPFYYFTLWHCLGLELTSNLCRGPKFGNLLSCKHFFVVFNCNQFLRSAVETMSSDQTLDNYLTITTTTFSGNWARKLPCLP